MKTPFVINGINDYKDSQIVVVMNDVIKAVINGSKWLKKGKCNKW